MNKHDYFPEFEDSKHVLKKDAYLAISDNEIVLVSELIKSWKTKGSTGWQPIETAPKDGTSVLLIHPHKGQDPYVGQWDKDKWRGFCEMCDGWTYIVQPTHWMPLLEPPKED